MEWNTHTLSWRQAENFPARDLGASLGFTEGLALGPGWALGRVLKPKLGLAEV
jgi:hypothetical protein